MRNFKQLSVAAAVVLAMMTGACGKKLPELKGIEWAAWKTDKDGCQRLREQSLDTLRAQKNLLLGLSEMQIVEVLGKPDRNEPYKRNQKFFFYFLQPATTCDSSSQAPTYLLVRFNAMGLAKEISVLN